MNHLESFHKSLNFEFEEKDYVLIDTGLFKIDVPFARIKEIPYLNYDTTDTVTVEVIKNNRIVDVLIFTEDVLRLLNDEEIKQYKLLKKTIKYNL